MKQAHEGRLHILDEMAKAIAEPRKELSRFAPQHAEVFVNPDIIRLIIGPGGKNIKAITAATGASVDIEDSGRVSIFAPTAEALEKAREMVSYYDQRPDLGKNYLAKVRKIMFDTLRDCAAIAEDSGIGMNLEALNITTDHGDPPLQIRCRISLAAVLQSGGKTAPDVPLCLVDIQHLLNLKVQGTVELGQPFRDVFMYGGTEKERFPPVCPTGTAA